MSRREEAPPARRPRALRALAAQLGGAVARRPGRCLAAASLFFAGAAFSALAGDTVGGLLESSSEASLHPAPASRAAELELAPAAAPATRLALSPTASLKPAAARTRREPKKARVPGARTKPSAGAAYARASKPLARRFARRLTRTAREARVDWPLLLAVVRARGGTGAAPTGPLRLERLAERLARLGPRDDPHALVLRLSGRAAFADRAVALARYHRAVGLSGLTRGLEAARPTLTARILRDPRVDLTDAARRDVASGRIDVRVLAVIAYLAEGHGQVSVSTLISGHRPYARPGVVSAHLYGRAVDITSLGGTPIAGHQSRRSVTEGAIRDLLLLPAEVRPQEVISLLALGGPSFSDPEHTDHIHVGYEPVTSSS